MIKKKFLTLLLLFPAALSLGAGYQLNLQGIRQLAMGGGGVATYWDAATIFYNPGGLSYLKGFQVYGSALAIVPRTSFVQQGSTTKVNTVEQTFTPFNIYVGGVAKEGSRLGFGVGIYTPFGSGTKWADDWTGRYVTQSIDLRAIFVQPTISYKLAENVSFGAGFIYAFGDVALTKAIPLQNTNGQDGQATLKGNAEGIGYNLGLSIKASECLSFGLSYHSRVNMDVEEGTANFSVPTTLSGNFPNTGFKTSLPLPRTFSAGLAYKPLERLTLQLDFNLTGWSAYDSLRFDYDNQTALLKNSSSARRYEDKLAIRIGGSYMAGKRMQFMMGAAYDPSPVRDGFVSPDLPDANRIIGTAGIAIKAAEHLHIMAVVEYIAGERRSASFNEAKFNGTYQTTVVTPGLGLTYTF